MTATYSSGGLSSWLDGQVSVGTAGSIVVTGTRIRGLLWNAADKTIYSGPIPGAPAGTYRLIWKGDIGDFGGAIGLNSNWRFLIFDTTTNEVNGGEVEGGFVMPGPFTDEFGIRFYYDDNSSAMGQPVVYGFAEDWNAIRIPAGANSFQFVPNQYTPDTYVRVYGGP